MFFPTPTVHSVQNQLIVSLGIRVNRSQPPAVQRTAEVQKMDLRTNGLRICVAHPLCYLAFKSILLPMFNTFILCLSFKQTHCPFCPNKKRHISLISHCILLKFTIYRWSSLLSSRCRLIFCGLITYELTCKLSFTSTPHKTVEEGEGGK